MIFCMIIGMLIVVALILFIFYIPKINDSIANSVETSLKSIPLPQKTTLCDSVSSAGKLVGNGDGMQYFGAILIKSELSLEELRNYYAKYQKNSSSCFVEKQLTKQITVVENIDLTFDALDKVNSFSGYYIVFSWGDSVFFPLGIFDIRSG